jgi:hypothetical protein
MSLTANDLRRLAALLDRQQPQPDLAAIMRTLGYTEQEAEEYLRRRPARGTHRACCPIPQTAEAR